MIAANWLIIKRLICVTHRLLHAAQYVIAPYILRLTVLHNVLPCKCARL